jgi:hypothetical protein
MPPAPRLRVALGKDVSVATRVSSAKKILTQVKFRLEHTNIFAFIKQILLG